jgi:hypothetical protein
MRSLLALVALLGVGAIPAGGQDTTIDPRWLGYVGCWERVGVAKSATCIVPTTDPAAIDLLTIVKGEVTARERIAATGERVQTSQGDCTGWQTATWSAHGQRLYLRSEDTCGGETNAGSGVIVMSGDRWLYIQSMTIGGHTGVRVQRYREATRELLLPGDVADALQLGVSAMMRARATAEAPLSIEDVVEASRTVDVPVVEALLVERAEPFALNAKRLIALADAGVPSRIIDLMVAVSYPRAFAINASTRQGERLPATRSDGVGTAPAGYPTTYDPVCYDYDPMFLYSYNCGAGGYGYGFGSDYGYGWNPGGVTIIYGGSSGGGSSHPHGRVVNGAGYAKGDDGPSTQAVPRSADSWSRPTSGSTSGSSGSGTQSTSTSSSSGATEQRTAKPRPQ